VKSFREVGGGCRVLKDSIFIPGGGGGIVGGQVTSGHPFMGILSHRSKYPAAFNQKLLVDLYEDRGRVGTEIGICVEDSRGNSTGGP